MQRKITVTPTSVERNQNEFELWTKTASEDREEMNSEKERGNKKMREEDNFFDSEAVENGKEMRERRRGMNTGMKGTQDTVDQA